MGRWTDIAQWRGPTVNHGGAMLEQRGLVVHIAEGSYEGTISWCKNPASSVSAHFVVAQDGRIAQVVDTDVTAWTQRDGNGHWLSVENEGHTPSALTAAQVEANARILAKAHQVYGVPLQLATSPSGRGLGHHSMGAESGVNWGHSECPGPAIKAQKPAILARAIAIASGRDDEMTPAEHDLLEGMAWRMDALTYMSPTVRGGPYKGEAAQEVTALIAIKAKVDALAAASGMDPAALQAAVAAAIAAATPAIADAVNDDAAARLKD